MSYSGEFGGLRAMYFNKVLPVPFAHGCEETGKCTDGVASGRFTLKKSRIFP